MRVRERDRERERARRARVKDAKEGKKDIRWAISRGKSEISKDIDTALKQEEDKRAGPGSAKYCAWHRHMSKPPASSCLHTGLFRVRVNFDTPLISGVDGPILKTFEVVSATTI